MDGPTDGPMDGPTDGLTDTVTYRVACTRLKKGEKKETRLIVQRCNLSILRYVFCNGSGSGGLGHGGGVGGGGDGGSGGSICGGQGIS